MAISTLDPDSMKQYSGKDGIDTAPNGSSAHQVYQTKVTPVKHPRTVGIEQLHQENFRVTSSNRRALHLATNSKRSKPIAVRIPRASRMDQTRDNNRARLQQQQPAQRQILHEADRQHSSRNRSNMIGTLYLQPIEDIRSIFHITSENSKFSEHDREITGFNSTGKGNFIDIRHHLKASPPTSTSTSVSASASASATSSASTTPSATTSTTA